MILCPVRPLPPSSFRIYESRGTRGSGTAEEAMVVTGRAGGRKRFDLTAWASGCVDYPKGRCSASIVACDAICRIPVRSRDWCGRRWKGGRAGGRHGVSQADGRGDTTACRASTDRLLALAEWSTMLHVVFTFLHECIGCCLFEIHPRTYKALDPNKQIVSSLTFTIGRLDKMCMSDCR